MMTEQEKIYYLALNLLVRIDEDMARDIKHYRNKGGQLLTTLNEVVRVILADELVVAAETQPGL